MGTQSTWGVIMRLSISLVAILVNFAFQRKFDVVWTDDDELTYLTPEEHKVAFRDVIMEGMVERGFEVFLAASRLRDHRVFDPKMLINDPQEIQDEIKFKKTETGLIDADFRAWGLKISGLHGLELENLHVVRHIGLHDIRVVAQVVTDLTGSGSLNISVTKLLLTGETFLVLKEDKESRDMDVFIKNVDMKMNNDKISVELENILGGGLIGDMANNILTLIGEEFLYAHKDMLTKRVSEKFKEKFSQIITMPDPSNVAQ